MACSSCGKKYPAKVNNSTTTTTAVITRMNPNRRVPVRGVLKPIKPQEPNNSE